MPRPVCSTIVNTQEVSLEFSSIEIGYSYKKLIVRCGDTFELFLNLTS